MLAEQARLKSYDGKTSLIRSFPSAPLSRAFLAVTCKTYLTLVVVVSVVRQSRRECFSLPVSNPSPLPSHAHMRARHTHTHTLHTTYTLGGVGRSLQHKTMWPRSICRGDCLVERVVQQDVGHEKKSWFAGSSTSNGQYVGKGCDVWLGRRAYPTRLLLPATTPGTKIHLQTRDGCCEYAYD